MPTPASVFTGDLLRALKIAGCADGNDWPRIARMLGFELRVAGTHARQVPAGPESAPARTAMPTARPPSIAETVPEDIGNLIEFDFELTTAPPQLIALPPATTDRSPAGMVSLNPLLDSLSERGILIEAVGTPSAEGKIAVFEAVRLIARGDPLRDVPRERIWSVSRGCQLLIDTGIGMQPFARDARQLVTSVRKVVGTYHTQVLTFIDCPSMGVLTETFEDVSYTPPDNGAVVLAVSDLCKGGPRSAIREADAEDWLGVGKQISDAGSLLVIMNPYGQDRWPDRVSQQIPIVHWDRSTRVGDVRKVRRKKRG